MRYGFMYRGRNIGIPWSADIPINYRFRGSGAWAVEEALRRTEPWREGDDPIETVELNRSVLAIVIPTRGQPVMWGNHRGHKAKRVQPSPFIEVDDLVRTRLFTIELIGSPRSPSLVRAYPGEYMPPLPWMTSAGWAPGGRQACVKFWRTHAYIYRDTIVDGRLDDQAPRWFRH